MGKLKDIEKFKRFHSYEDWLRDSVKIPIEQMRITNDPEIKVLLENMSDDELQKHWIDYERISKIPEYGNPLTFSMVWNSLEPDHTTYPIDKTIEYIKKYFDLPDNWVEKKMDTNGEEQIVVVIPIVANNLEKFKRGMILCGWYYVELNEDKIIQNQLQKMQFKQIIYPDDSKQIRNEEKTLFYFTSYYYLDRIKRLGIISGIEDELTIYPSENYFFRGSTEKNEILAFTEQLRKTIAIKHMNGKRNRTKFCLIEIDLNEVPKSVKLCLDQNYKYGIHTYDSIMPDAITNIEEIKI